MPYRSERIDEPMFDLLFSPVKIGALTLKNRLITSAMESCYCDDNGNITQRYIDYVTARAKGGWGMLTTELTSVSKDGRAFLHCCEFWSDDFIAGHRLVTGAAHRYGAKICIQLAHGGRQTGRAVTGVQNVAPSAIACPVRANTPEDMPRELTAKEIHQIIDDFAQTARRAKQAGYDAIELHGAHGYLIQQFFSPFSNKRSDRYGGSLYNRARFALEIIAAVRKQVGNDFPIIFRISASEMMDGARLTIGDTRALAVLLEQAGIDAINASVGAHATIGSLPVCPAAVPHGYNLDFAQEFKKVVSIPVFGNGRINDPFIAESVLRSKKADVIAMGRASLSDPAFPNKAQSGRIDEIITCVACMQGCTGNLKRGSQPIECLVNPMLGHEGEYTFDPVTQPKKIAVVGGGIAGAAAAIAAARRGHHVELFEKNDRLGGQWLYAAVPPNKQELTTLVAWQTRQLELLSVPVRLNCTFTPELAQKGGYDAVIVATGATPIIPRIKGADGDQVMTAADVLSLTGNPGKRVVIVGGGQVGCETAAFLANQSREVAILEMMPTIPVEGEPGVNYYLKQDLDAHKVVQIAGAKVLSIEAGTVIYEKSGEKHTVERVDNVVLAIGSRSVNALGEALVGLVPKVEVVGDASKPGKGLVAHAQGFAAGYYI